MLDVQSDRTRVVAPVDGVVSKRSAVVGAVVQTGTELFRIVRDGRIEVAAKVAEQHLADIHPGQSAEVTDAAGNRSPGTVRAIAPTVDEKTRLGIVHVALPPGTSLKPGMSARVAIGAEAQTVLTVPQAAIVWRDGETGVFMVAADGTVAFQAITTGSRADGRVAVTGGIAEGDRIVTAGAGFLSDGSHVRVAVADAVDDGAVSQ
jgi:RND family efflux transporter MFP subunit